MSRGALASALAAACLCLPVVASATVITVPTVSQDQSLWCWDAVSRSLMLDYGRDVSECTIASYAKNGECCATPLASFCDQPDSLATIVRILGHWQASGAMVVPTPLSAAAIETESSAGRPFVIEWSRGFIGHVVVGHGISGQNVYYMDPAPGEGEMIADYDWVVSGDGHTWDRTLVMLAAPCSARPDGDPCDDGSACVTGEQCKNGTCEGSVSTTCPAGSLCQPNAGCDPASGACVAPTLACDYTFVCTAAACDPHTGHCAVTNVAAGTPCPSASTIPCQTSVCSGDGACVAKPVDEGKACSIADHCGTCAAGECVVSLSACPPHGATCMGGCNRTLGTCDPTLPVADGLPCDDGDPCTSGDRCEKGSCTGAAVTCPSPGECQLAACAASTGQCATTAAPDGQVCSTGSCHDGLCVTSSRGCSFAPGAR